MSTKMTLFQSLYVYEPPKWKEYALFNSRVPTIRNQIEEYQNIIQILKYILTNAWNRMKQQANL